MLALVSRVWGLEFLTRWLPAVCFEVLVGSYRGDVSFLVMIHTVQLRLDLNFEMEFLTFGRFDGETFRETAQVDLACSNWEIYLFTE